MNSFLFLTAFFFWGLFWISDLWLRLIASVSVLFYFLVRFPGKKRIFLWIVLAAFSLISLSRLRMSESEPPAGSYQIIQIRSGYSIARNRDRPENCVVVYDTEDCLLDDILHLEIFEPVYSLKNPGVFSFQKMMNEKGIFWSSSVTENTKTESGKSIRRWLFRAVSEKDRTGLLKYLIYGISFENKADWVSSLGLPLLGFLDLVRKTSSKFFDKKGQSLIQLFTGAVYGCLFGFSPSVIRIAVFTACSLILHKQRMKILPASMIAFLILASESARSFAFVLPVLMQLNSEFHKKRIDRLITGKMLLIMLQILYFQQISPLMLLGYRKLRVLSGWCMIIGILSSLFGFIEVEESILQMLSSDPKWLSDLIFHGAASRPVAAAFIVSVICLLIFPLRKSFRMAVFSIALYIFSIYLDPFYHVYQLDIGQGDCCIVTAPFRQSTVMIDAAGNLYRDNYDRVIRPFLTAHRIDSIDALIITHDDFDHSGSRDSLLEDPNIQVKDLIESSERMPETEYPFYSLLPERNSSDENDKSVVSYFALDAFEFLWTGDASKEIEKQLLDEYSLYPDVIKLGHHGSNTSSDLQFLKRCAPELAIISAGNNNRYNHPHPETLRNLKKASVDALQTSESGCITMSVFRNLMLIRTESGLFSWIIKTE